MSKIKAEFHQPVLLKQTIEWLKVKPGCTYIDCTLGGAGHTQAILAKGGRVIGLDRDPEAIKFANERLSHTCPDAHWQLIKADFKDLAQILEKHEIKKVSGILLDLGVSSYQLDTKERGFSFQKDETLDMRMDPNASVKAVDLVNGLYEKELAELFFKLGEERLARPIAKAIIEQRKKEPVQTTRQLADLVTGIYKRHYSVRSKIHPATKVFLALRIAVNDELNNLKAVLPQVVKVLTAKGRLVVLSFHSLEDRIVKNFLKKGKDQGWLTILTKKPIVPQKKEKELNPRSRSAKLRAAEKI